VRNRPEFSEHSKTASDKVHDHVCGEFNCGIAIRDAYLPRSPNHESEVQIIIQPPIQEVGSQGLLALKAGRHGSPHGFRRGM
jgi:hypothetical protein